MGDQRNNAHSWLGCAARRTLLITLASISSLGLAAWTWMQRNRSLLPSPESDAGQDLLNQYQVLTHHLWLIALLLAVGFLSWRVQSSRQHEACTRNHTSARPVEACLRFILNNPITRVLFIAYAVAMISGTTYLYKDLVGCSPRDIFSTTLQREGASSMRPCGARIIAFSPLPTRNSTS